MLKLKRNEAEEALPLDPGERETFGLLLLAWYRRNARSLPWRGIHNPYRTWVSEIMLQQTRVGAVVDHYHRFLERFPTVVSLALAEEAEVLALWSGLGYYRRARMLHRAAKFLLQEHGGSLPHTSAELRKLPGIGAYTSAAIASIAFGERVAVVDGNVERVLLRVAGKAEKPGRTAEQFLARFAQSIVPEDQPGDHNQAMMELGATVCLPRNPLCMECPVFGLCRTRGEHSTLPRSAMRSERVAYAITTRKPARSTQAEVLLRRRGQEMSLMPDMLELPPLATPPQEEPSLRLRHSIVGTNYYVEIYAMGKRREVQRRLLLQGEEDKPDMQWFSLKELPRLPLTGLARKALQRMGLMATGNGAVVATKPVEVPLLIGRHKLVSEGVK